MAHPAKEVGLHLACAVRTLESLLKGLLLTRLVLDRVVDVHEHAHARAGNALLVAPELRGGANPHAPAVLTPHAVVDIVRTPSVAAMRNSLLMRARSSGAMNLSEFSLFSGKSSPLSKPRTRRHSSENQNPVGLPASSKPAVQQAACKRLRASATSCSKAHSAIARCFCCISISASASARCVRRSSSMSSRSRSLRSATPAKSKGDEASPFPDLAFAPSFMFVPPPNHRPIRPTSVWP